MFNVIQDIKWKEEAYESSHKRGTHSYLEIEYTGANFLKIFLKKSSQTVCYVNSNTWLEKK